MKIDEAKMSGNTRDANGVSIREPFGLSKTKRFWIVFGILAIAMLVTMP